MFLEDLTKSSSSSVKRIANPDPKESAGKPQLPSRDSSSVSHSSVQLQLSLLVPKLHKAVNEFLLACTSEYVPVADILYEQSLVI